MATFIIDENEYEVKLDYKSVQRLNREFSGGALELVGLSLSGDLDAFPTILHAGLLHTDKNFTKKKINEEIEKAFENETLTFEYIHKLMNEVVTNSFFFRPTVNNMMKKNPEMKKELDNLLG